MNPTDRAPHSPRPQRPISDAAHRLPRLPALRHPRAGLSGVLVPSSRWAGGHAAGRTRGAPGDRIAAL